MIRYGTDNMSHFTVKNKENAFKLLIFFIVLMKKGNVENLGEAGVEEGLQVVLERQGAVLLHPQVQKIKIRGVPVLLLELK